MVIPIFLSARPKHSNEHSGIVRLREGKWWITSSTLDSKVVIRTSDSPLTILAMPMIELPIELLGPIYVMASIIARGSEPNIDVMATKVLEEKTCQPQ